MKIRKTLLSCILAGTLALGGCKDLSDKDEYEFDGKIGETKIKFYNEVEGGTGDSMHRENTLRVKRPDGKYLTYVDEDNDLKLDTVFTHSDGETQIYSADNEFDAPVLNEAQKQFDDYLSQIKRHKLGEKRKYLDTGLKYLE